jgi:hypothetical protein
METRNSDLEQRIVKLERDIESMRRLKKPLVEREEKLNAELLEARKEFAIAQIANLGEWRQPAVDDYWRAAIASKAADSLDFYRFQKLAFERAGLMALATTTKTDERRFIVPNLSDPEANDAELRATLVTALQAFSLMYKPIKHVDGDYISFMLGNVEDKNAKYGTEPYDIEFEIEVSPTGDFCRTPWGTFKGQNCIEESVEQMLQMRAKFLNISPPSEPSRTLTPGT